MNEELKIIILTSLVGLVIGFFISKVLGKCKIGKKESLEEIDEKIFGKK